VCARDRVCVSVCVRACECIFVSAFGRVSEFMRVCELAYLFPCLCVCVCYVCVWFVCVGACVCVCGCIL